VTVDVDNSDNLDVPKELLDGNADTAVRLFLLHSITPDPLILRSACFCFIQYIDVTRPPGTLPTVQCLAAQEGLPLDHGLLSSSLMARKFFNSLHKLQVPFEDRWQLIHVWYQLPESQHMNVHRLLNEWSGGIESAPDVIAALKALMPVAVST
jgi:hypothetical protein